MGISEKIIHSDAFHVNIYKEGVFWVAYEQSAYYFWLQKGYKPTKKFVKSIGQEIASIGFPQNALHTSCNCLIERDEANMKIFLTEEAIDRNAFEEWKTQIPVYNALRTKEKQVEKEINDGLSDEITAQIRDFPLADKTPVECMLFLSELKKMTIHHGNLR
jgi:hypothetical protein